MCDQWSDITLWWNILTPLEAQGCDKGGSKAARQQYQREYKTGSDDWFLCQQWQATLRLHYTSKDLGGWEGFQAFLLEDSSVSDHSFQEAPGKAVAKVSFYITVSGGVWANIAFLELVCKQIPDALLVGRRGLWSTCCTLSPENKAPWQFQWNLKPLFWKALSCCNPGVERSS